MAWQANLNPRDAAPGSSPPPAEAASDGAAALTPRQHQSREQSLTQPHAARLRVGINAIVLKFDDTFLVSDIAGDFHGGQGRGVGLFYRDTRFLSAYELSLADAPLWALSSEHGGGDWVSHSLENQSLEASAEGEPHSIAVRRYRTAGDGEVRELLVVTNYAMRATTVHLRLRFEADFADVFQVRSLTAAQPHQQRGSRADEAQLSLWALGEDGRRRSTTLHFDPAPTRLTEDCATFDLKLAAGSTAEIDVHIRLHESRSGGDGEARPPDSTRRAAFDPRRLKQGVDPQGRELLDGATQLHSDPRLEKLVRRSLLDVAMLRCRLRSDLQYIAAGVPWFVTLFGRDSAICALQLCAFRADIAGDTARLLARRQATQIDRFRDAQPGKILHELRRGQLARLNLIPQSPAYYGSVDVTLLFIVLIDAWLAWSGDVAAVRALRPNLQAALDWIERYGDGDGDGYLDYGGGQADGSYQGGLVNQGWKDSGDAIVNADGSLATPPIALCEVQGYLYRAWQSAARTLRHLGEERSAADLDHKAAALCERFERDYWSGKLGCYVLARQHGGRAAEVVSSNAGQVLWSGIASAEHAAAVERRMMAPDMFSGWGVRTLSAQERRYNPLSYHLGSVWPHDNAMLCAGFRRYGHDGSALRIFDALCAAASGFRNQRMPELYCGFARSAEESHPVPYPVACSPQAWAAGSIPYALTSLLGLAADAPEAVLRICDPCLPDWAGHVQLCGLRVGDASIDLTFERDVHGRVHVDSTVRSGTLRVEHITR